MSKEFYLGNELIANALKSMGVSSFYSYPGSPISEILPYLKDISKECYTQWSINEKVAFELSAAAAISGNISACAMKQVGLNVASDSLFSIAYTGINGALVIISADDTGPYSSQTEQDSRLYAYAAKIPVLDPSSAKDLYYLTKKAVEISKKYKIPVMIRPTMRICHSRQTFEIENIETCVKKRFFVKDINRWAATPKYRAELHKELIKKLDNIATDFYDDFNFNVKNKYVVVASGYPASVFQDIQDMYDNIDFIKIDMPHPISQNLIERIENSYEKILILEESMPLLENTFNNRKKVFGKNTGNTNFSGEFTIDTCIEILNNFLGLNNDKEIKNLKVNNTKPYLCVGCGHRSAFFAIKQATASAIFPSDIGCYTLGVNMKAVDTCICMGASISFAESLKRENPQKTVVCTIGDSTFFHSGLTPLLNAKINNAPIVVAILDNKTTAMTGFQPVAHQISDIKIENICKSFNIDFIEVADPYDINKSIEIVKNAVNYAENNNTPAVIIFRKECVTESKLHLGKIPFVDKGCSNCGMCYEVLQCPAITYNGETVEIDKDSCNGCMSCVQVCPTNILKEI